MSDLTTTSYLILGLLTSRDWSAYELTEQMGRGLVEIWPRAGRHWYDAPKRLLADGLITARKETSAGRRQRTVYSITRSGRKALRRWLATTPDPPALEFEGMVRVLVAEQGSLDDLRATLRTIEEQARVRRTLFEAHADHILATGGTFPEREHLFALSTEFMIGHFTHLAEWASWAQARTDTWADTVTPATTHHDESRSILARGAGAHAVPPAHPTAVKRSAEKAARKAAAKKRASPR